MSFVLDLIKLDAAPDRKDYNDVIGSKKTCSTAVPLSAEPDKIVLRKIFKGNDSLWSGVLVYY